MDWAFYGKALLLAGLLYFPVQRLVLALSANRLARKLRRALTAEEIAGQKRRAHFIAVIVTPPFSFLFNLGLLD
jgi:hypothetical protein